MTPQLFVDIALVPALRLLPARMDTPEARAMIIAICLQESKLQHRLQIGGPARGYAQFERMGGVNGVLTHPTSRPHAINVCSALDVLADTNKCYEAIAYNDVLAAVFARLLLWTSPLALPKRGNAQDGWQMYLANWRPGKPHPATWDAYYAQAWTVVTEEE